MQPLSAELRARTAAAHAEVEHSPFLAALAAGEVTVAGLAALQQRLLPVYAALEAALAPRAADPLVGPFAAPALQRSARLRTDLRHLTGSDRVPPTPAARAYAGRVAQVAGSAPAVAAHAWTRYAGDLSGGRVVRAALERRLGLADGAGTSFLHVPGVRAGAALRALRAALDDAPLTSAQREELVQEVLRAFRLSADLTRELDEDLQRWTVSAAPPPTCGGRPRPTG